MKKALSVLLSVFFVCLLAFPPSSANPKSPFGLYLTNRVITEGSLTTVSITWDLIADPASDLAVMVTIPQGVASTDIKPFECDGTAQCVFKIQMHRANTGGMGTSFQVQGLSSGTYTISGDFKNSSGREETLSVDLVVLPQIPYRVFLPLQYN